jgi:hypothetical protein
MARSFADQLDKAREEAIRQKQDLVRVTLSSPVENVRALAAALHAAANTMSGR